MEGARLGLGYQTDKNQRWVLTVGSVVRESPKTTKLYDRTSDQITLDEIERITI
jgi:hypothetical protein